MTVDRDLRLRHAALNTAGHLLCNLVEQVEPGLKGIKSYHFPEGPYIEFEGARSEKSAADFLGILKYALEGILSGETLSITVGEHAAASAEAGGSERVHREVKIGAFRPIPCGGTHLQDLAELKSEDRRNKASLAPHVPVPQGPKRERAEGKRQGDMRSNPRLGLPRYQLRQSEPSDC